MTEVITPLTRKLAGKREGGGDEDGATSRDNLRTGQDITNSGEAVCARSRAMMALTMANEVRFERARIKRELLSGEMNFTDLLDDLPESCEGVKVIDLVRWIPGVGPGRARGFVRGIIFSDTIKIGALSPKGREELAYRSRHYRAWRPRQKVA